jgi:gamma-glutamyltranspeptidase / glutathione hydrolase
MLLLAVSCGGAGTGGDDALSGPGVAARSRSGMVVSGSPLATAVGVRVLAEGGNAVDAAVATAFALAVVEPTMSGLGGRTQLVLRTADGVVSAIDGTTEVPPSWTGERFDDEDAFGYATIAVPGTVAALAMALREHGTWPLARILEPAIQLARGGFALPAAEAERIANAAKRLAEFPSSGQYFLKSDGSTYSDGDTLIQTDLAATLRAIADGGDDAFYRGEIAQRIANDVQAHGGFVTMADLAAYHAEESIVVHGTYRGYELIGSYLPASGATTIEILQIMDQLDLAPIAGSPEWVLAVSRALLAGFEDREAEVQPAEAKAAWLTSSALAQERAHDLGLPAGAAASPRRISGDASESSSSSHSNDSTRRDGREPEFTTHLSVADRHGGVVALTQSVGPLMGSKVAAPGLGFIHAATMEYLGELEPGTRRHWSSQSPLLVLRDGEPVLIIGAAGARRIISRVVETISRWIDEELPLQQAVAAPRFHPTPSRIDVEVRAGASWTEADVARLTTYGLNVRKRDDAPYFARVNAIARDSAGRAWIGVAEPRWQGAAGGPSGRR